ncbi:MAG TPA: ABC transporter substrate-binding protein [Dehalococcoidia bacterium]|nr:ABC transporter substrate-binding protein [Dehalococcoidia bacterium]
MFRSKALILLALVMLLIGALAVSACGGTEEEAGGGGEKTAVPAGPGVGETIGVTDTSIKIGTLLPISNTTAAAWGVPLSKGMKAFYDYVNDNGGIYGRKIDFIVGDSQYTGPVASEIIRKMVEQDGIFLLQGSLGTEAHMAVYKYLEEKGIPDMYILTGNTIWTEPVAHNRFAWLVDYIDEGRILGRYIGENFDGKKLGILAQNDDFGKEGEEGLKLGLEDAGANMEITTQYYDATQTDVTAQIQRLKADNVDVIGYYGMPAQAASGFHAARETLTWDVPIVISGVDAVEIVGQLAGYDNIEGAVSVVYGHQAFESDWPGIQEFGEILAEYAPGEPLDNLTLTGMSISESIVATLRQAGSDLTRSSFLEAAESGCNITSRASLVPSSLSPTDHRPTEVEQYVRATVDRTDPDNPKFTWEPFGDLIQFESTKDCKEPTPPADFDKQPK